MNLGIFPSTTLARFKSALEINQTEFDYLPVPGEPWHGEAKRFLERAKAMAGEGDVEAGWRALHAAREAMSGGWTKQECEIQIERLRPETLKLSAWRAETVTRLLDLAKFRLRASDLAGTRAILREVMQIRHEHFSNEYHKLWTIRVQVYGLARLTAAAVLVLLMMGSFFPWSTWRGGSPPHLFGAVLFGLLGACVSSIQSLTKLPSDGKIPDVFAQNTVSWTRVGLGTAMGLVAVTALESGFLNLGPITPLKSMIVAFAAGFSEKLVIGVANKVGG